MTRAAVAQPGLSVEEVGPAAADLIAALTGKAGGDPWRADSVSGILALPGTFALIASLDGQPSGFILVRVAADESEIINFAVAPSARRRGVGRFLLEAALATAGERGAYAIFLEVARDNTAARALYSEKGFEQVGIRTNYYRRGPENYTDALILRRELITNAAPCD